MKNWPPKLTRAVLDAWDGFSIDNETGIEALYEAVDALRDYDLIDEPRKCAHCGDLDPRCAYWAGAIGRRVRCEKWAGHPGGCLGSDRKHWEEWERDDRAYTCERCADDDPLRAGGGENG